MPDDSATQKAHAERIKTERVLMEMLGKNRSEIRNLTTFANGVIEAKRKSVEKFEAKPPASVTSVVTSIQGGGLAGADVGAVPGNQAKPAQAPTFTQTVIVARVLKYALTHGTILGNV